MKIEALKTRLFEENENLEDFIFEHLPVLSAGDVLVVTSKIVALSEGRTATLTEKEKLVDEESEWTMPAKHATLTITNGMLMPSAGIDESNAQGKLILLPKDAYRTAYNLRNEFCKKYGLKDLGVIITDSRTWPLRAGSVGVAIGYAGFQGIKDYRGTNDLFGRELKFTQINIADSLAASAVLLMGEGTESRPITVINDAPLNFTDVSNYKELIVSKDEDLYAPMFDRYTQR